MVRVRQDDIESKLLTNLTYHAKLQFFSKLAIDENCAAQYLHCTANVHLGRDPTILAPGLCLNWNHALSHKENRQVILHVQTGVLRQESNATSRMHLQRTHLRNCIQLFCFVTWPHVF